MNLLPRTMAAILGLGVAELFVILIILSVLAVPILIVLWVVLRGEKKVDANAKPPERHYGS